MARTKAVQLLAGMGGRLAGDRRRRWPTDVAAFAVTAGAGCPNPLRRQVGTLARLLAGGIPHLHYEVQTLATGRWEVFQVSNPHLYWVDGPGDVTCFDRRKLYPSERFRTTYPVPCRGVPWR